MEFGGINRQSKPSKLLKKADISSPILAHFPPNAFAKYIRSGESGRWHYVEYLGHEYAIHNSRITFGFYRIFNLTVLSEHQLRNIMYGSSSLTILCSILLIRTRRKRKRKTADAPPLSPKQQKLVERTYTQREVEEMVQSVTSLKDEELKKAVQKTETRHKHELDNHRTRIENELSVGLKKELEKIYAPSLAAMQESYKNLKAIHEKAIVDARAFDVDFKDKKFESILKGRLFEIRMASYFEKDLRLRIVNWAPDKGFLSGIFVESNLHPDLHLATRNGDQFAVECKYIGRKPMYINNLKMPDAITWAKEKQPQRYTNFGSERNIPVWVAIGHLGPADDPHSIYLTPIELMQSNSRLWKKSNPEWACRLPFLKEWETDLCQTLPIADLLSPPTTESVD